MVRTSAHVGIGGGLPAPAPILPRGVASALRLRRNMHVAALIVGSLGIATILWDAFETIALPRTASRKIRLSRYFYRHTWRLCVALARRFGSDRRRERILAVYGPLSVFGLLAVWAAGLITGFALVLWSQGALLSSLPGDPLLFDLFYLSGSTLFTLGPGNLSPHDMSSRVLTVAEAGIGLALLSLVVSYLPVLYGAFSRREVRVTLLDAWGGSPPAAAEVLCRLAKAGDAAAVDEFLKEWEHWSAELLESHLSYPAVAYFRSQHRDQSWVSALTTVLDVSALLKIGIDALPTWRASSTFAIAQHAAFDIARILGAPVNPAVSRLPPEERAALQADLERSGLVLKQGDDHASELARLRGLYEPYVAALSILLMMPLPPWRHARDCWDVID